MAERMRTSEPRSVCLDLANDFAFFRDTLAVPCAEADGQSRLATADMSPANLIRLRARFGAGVPIDFVTRAAVIAGLAEYFAGHLLDGATQALARTHPELSASRVITMRQAMTFLVAIALPATGAWLAPKICEPVIASILVFGFLANALFRSVLVWMGAEPPASADSTVACADEDLPHYSILVPLYREAEIVPQLIAAIGGLDYPQDRLEIVLVIEADDVETRAALAALPLDERFAVIAVPPGMPRTKPRAANFGLSLLSGEFTVIYDAEDRPEPDQLRKAVAAFRAAPPNVACLQARLNFYNARECWLTVGIMAQTPLC